MTTKPQVMLQDDDEFEDFPVKDATQKPAQLPQWQDTWEDDDTTVDFAVQLQEQHSKKDQMKL